MRPTSQRVAVVLAALLLVWTGCASQPSPGVARDSSGEQSPRAPKRLTFAIQQEPLSLIREIGIGTGASGGGYLPMSIAHNHLVRIDDSGTYRSEIAVENPSFEKRTWQINPDQSMEMTWRLHPNVKWHDGTPFTADDMVFSLNVLKDPETATTLKWEAALVQATAPDPHTLVMRWSTTYAWVNRITRMGPLPRHLLQDLYSTNKASLHNSPWFSSTEFVGLGPYRLTAWEPGSHMEFAAFDGYYRGRPPLDTIIVRFVSDNNAVVAGVLAGAMDVVPAIGIGLDSEMAVKERWEGTGNQVIPVLNTPFRIVESQQRLEFARPRGGLTSTSVRLALYHAIDRKALADAITLGIGSEADSWLAPTDGMRPQLSASIPQFPYDPARAQALLAQSGWVTGTDGALVNRDTNERFEIQLAGRGSSDMKEAAIVADYWKRVGVRPELYDIPAALARSNEHRAKLPGVWVSGIQYENLVTNRLLTREIQSAANQWSSQNKSGYSNPKADVLFDRLAVTVVPAEELSVLKELLREVIGDLAVMPLYWEPEHWLMVKGVKGQAHRTLQSLDFFVWDRE